jgi:hypothetical protein
LDQPAAGRACAHSAQFALQPWDYDTPGQPNGDFVHRINLAYDSLPANGEVTFLTDWAAGQPLKFYAAYGSYTAANFPFDDPNTISWQTPAAAQSQVPAPTPTLSLYVNLWPYGGPTTNDTVTFSLVALELPPFAPAS